MSARFLGVDLGWFGKPTGVASITWDGSNLRLKQAMRIEDPAALPAWMESEAGTGSAVVGVDAPLVIRNPKGIRPCEVELNREFRRFHAGCHPANLGRPFAPYVTAFSHCLASAGFQHGAEIQARKRARVQIEVHPHAASINLFSLDRIVKYKRGRREDRARELNRLRGLLLNRLPKLNPPLSLRLPLVPKAGPLKPVEDQIDAVLCAYIAAYWWFWARERNTVYGYMDSGYIVVPKSVNLVS